MTILREMCLTPLSRLVDQRLHWLVPGRIAAGSLTMLDGDPGQGKSLLTLDLAARLSTGRPFPDVVGQPAGLPPASTILLSAEDDFECTIRPRLLAAGADCDRIHRFQVRAAGLAGLPTFPDDCELLGRALRETAARLVIFDPFFAFLSAAAAGFNQLLLRQVLAPLARVAADSAAAFVFVRHLTKGGQGRQALYRGAGGMAIIGAARTAFLAGPHPDDPALHLLACTKCNLAVPPPTLAYRIDTTPDGLPVVRWHGPVSLSANDIVLKPAPESEALPEAIAYLKDILGHGPATRDSIVRLAHAKGLTLRTLERAKAELEIESTQKWENDRNVWHWSLPPDRDSEDILRDLLAFVSGKEPS